ncbi:MAG: family 16 glycoside hydrolase [Candidatus Cyclobacteriaceae bacterium M3_2C_046]
MKKFALIAIAIMALMAGCDQPKATDEWVSLFNGQDLEGWRSNEDPQAFQVQDEMIVVSGNRSHLFYEGEVNQGNFKNFEFKADVKTTRAANSGIYFHTAYQDEGWPAKGYEVQVNNYAEEHNGYKELKKTGSLYAVRNLYVPFVEDEEWFTLHFKVDENRVQISVNDKMVVDYIQPDNPYRNEDQQERVVSNGTFAIQCHDPQSTVYYKNIMVKPLPEGEKYELEVSPEYDLAITKLHAAGFPLIDYHVHLKGGLTMDQALEHMRKTGVNYGIAVNCGLDFDINSNEKLQAYIEEQKDQPVFNAMQAEGREWLDLFSVESITSFDYVFTDALTFDFPNGKRTHLWIPEEVSIEDKEAWMDYYVDIIVGIISSEPIDIFVNPTFLPEVIAEEYDALWTEERMGKVVQALVDSGVALEINARYEIPSQAFIQFAKDRGVTFACGTNNTANEIGNQQYCLDMIEACGLTTQDMFMPKEEGQKPIQQEGAMAENL